MAITQQALALQMLAQLRRLDPSLSAEVGTPERKIVDTVAQALADAQIDLEALRSGFDLDAKFGDALDRFLALFGFARQRSTFATGFVTFSRESASTLDITIPVDSQVRVPDLGDASDATSIGAVFYVSATTVLPAGQTTVVAPIRAVTAGSSSNVAAGLITQIVGTPVFGITGVTNEIATRGGIDQESDDELKIRFKNTVFRNLAGTKDQYLALAVSTAYSLKASVVGAQSLWREYMQIPPVDDASAYSVAQNGIDNAGGGVAGQYTTALSSFPFAKAIWTNLPTYVSNGAPGPVAYFYRPDADFTMNVTPETTNRGDAKRFNEALPDEPDPAVTFNRPNITFSNVYTGVNVEVQAVRPNDVVLVEYSYMSDASRNNLTNNITNAVDVFVDGGNLQPATTVLTAPGLSELFVDNPTSKYHYENYRRIGEPYHRPIKGNYFMPLMWQPVTGLPAQIIIGDNTYLRGTHYWPVEETTDIGGSTRARGGIEWSKTVKGESTTTPRLVSEWVGGNFQPIEVEEYIYDRNIADLQIALEGNKQITSDVLAHKAFRRYFKFDITVMYAAGYIAGDVNTGIRTAVDNYLQAQYFGATLQLSDILSVIHDVPGVDNVRWSSDLPYHDDLARVYECDINGNPLLSVTTEHIQIGTASTPAIQAIYINGEPEGVLLGASGTWPGFSTLDPYVIFKQGVEVSPARARISELELPTWFDIALEAITGLGTVTVTEETRSTVGVRHPIRSFLVTWTTNGAKTLITADSHLKGGPTVLYSDFILRDNELPALPTLMSTLTTFGEDDYSLPADAVAGFIIRTRAQNTFKRGG